MLLLHLNRSLSGSLLTHVRTAAGDAPSPRSPGSVAGSKGTKDWVPPQIARHSAPLVYFYPSLSLSLSFSLSLSLNNFVCVCVCTALTNRRHPHRKRGPRARARTFCFFITTKIGTRRFLSRSKNITSKGTSFKSTKTPLNQKIENCARK